MARPQETASTLFTPAEAAVLTRLSVKAVNNAIDRRTVSAVGGDRGGRATRLLDLNGLMALALERRLADRFLPEARREIFEALSTARDSVSLEGGFVKVDLREPRRELAGALRQLRRARRLVQSDPDVLGGEPVFQGTRIPVYVIASMLEQGSRDIDLRQAYPKLTSAMIQVASLYATAYPRRGRPHLQPWRHQVPRQRTRRKLVTIDVA